MRDGRDLSRYTVLSACTVWVWRPMGSPVFGLTSNRGKLLPLNEFIYHCLLPQEMKARGQA